MFRLWGKLGDQWKRKAREAQASWMFAANVVCRYFKYGCARGVGVFFLERWLEEEEKQKCSGIQLKKLLQTSELHECFMREPLEQIERRRHLAARGEDIVNSQWAVALEVSLLKKLPEGQACC